MTHLQIFFIYIFIITWFVYYAFRSTLHEIIKTVTRRAQQQLHYLGKLRNGALSTRATVFADCSVYFIYLHTRDNSGRSRSRLSFSRGATFLMQLAPFLPYKSYCGASRALRIHSTCIHIRIRDPRYSLHSRSNKGCNPRASAANLPKNEGWRTGSFKSSRYPYILIICYGSILHNITFDTYSRKN